MFEFGGCLKDVDVCPHYREGQAFELPDPFILRGMFVSKFPPDRAHRIIAVYCVIKTLIPKCHSR